MKFFIFLSLLFFILGEIANSQDLSMDFGIISKNEFDFSTYPDDPNAEAVVIFDYGESYFYDTDDGGYNIRFTRTKRIKVLEQAGIEYAEISIPYYVDGAGKTESVTSIEAFSYNIENGMLDRKILDKGTIYEETINERWRAKKFAVPHVKKGTVFEFMYELETPFHFNLPDWQFQDRIPTIHSQYTVKMIPFYEYIFIAQGITKFSNRQSYVDDIKRTFGSVIYAQQRNIGQGVEFKDQIHIYEMKDVPAFKDESFITSHNDYIMKMDFQLAKIHYPNGATTEYLTTWPDLNEKLIKNDDFGKYIKRSEKLANNLLKTELKINGMSEFELAKKLIAYAKNSLIWNGTYSKFASKNPKNLLTDKTGNSADINLFLVGLLRAGGILADPVILSTRDHGKINSKYPFSEFFNHVIVSINLDGNLNLSDGTEPLIAFNRIPPKCINDKGLMVIQDEVRWIDLQADFLSYDNKTIKMDIDKENLTIDISVNNEVTEYQALFYKKRYVNDTKKIEDQLLETGIINTSEIRTENYENPELPYEISYNGQIDLEQIDNKILITPFLKFPIQENPLTQRTRNYPVDFIFSSSDSITSIINIPKGYKVLDIPDNFLMDNILSTINIEYFVDGQSIKVIGVYKFKKAVYQPKEYHSLRSYRNTIVKLFNKQIVLEPELIE